MNEETAKIMVAMNGTFIGKHQTKSFVFDVLCWIRTFFILAVVVVGILHHFHGTHHAFVVVGFCTMMLLWRIARVRMHLDRTISRMEAKEPRPSEVDRLAEVTRSKYWYTAIAGLAYPTWILCEIAYTFTILAPLFFIVASFLAKKQLAKQVVNYIKWYDKHEKNKERMNSIDKEWISFGKWMMDNKIPRQAPAGFIEVYEKYTAQKAAPCTTCSCVKTQSSPP